MRILGASDPGGAEIWLDRQNNNLTGPLDKIRKDEPRVRRIRPPKGSDIDLVHTTEPGGENDAMEIRDPDFEVLGKRRVVRKREAAKSRGGSKIVDKPDTPPASVSGGRPYGGNPGTGAASIAAPETTESKGFLRLWGTLQRLANDASSGIVSVAAVAADGSLSPEPVLIPFPPPDDTALAPVSRKNWPYLNPRGRGRKRRGALLIRVETTRGVGHLLETQRRPHEKYKGLALKMDGAEMGRRMGEVLAAVANAEGVMDSAAWNLGAQAQGFLHSRDAKKKPDRALLRALYRMELIDRIP